MTDFYDVSGVEAGFWHDYPTGLNHDDYSISIPSGDLFYDSVTLTWDFDNEMTLTRTTYGPGYRDLNSVKEYSVYFTTPNDGITHNYTLDVLLNIPDGTLSATCTPMIIKYGILYDPDHTSYGHLNDYWMGSFYSGSLISSAPFSYTNTPNYDILPNTIVKISLWILYGLNYCGAPPFEVPFNGHVVVDGPPQITNVIRMIIEQN